MSDSRVQLTVSGIQADLNSGLTRPQIQEKYGLNTRDLKELFNHPKLKGLKTKAAPKFVLVDDTEDVEEAVATPVVDEVVEETPVVETTDESAPIMPEIPNVDNDFRQSTPNITNEFGN